MEKICVIPIIAILFTMVSCKPSTREIVVINSSDNYRSDEIVEVKVSELGLKESTSLYVTDSKGEEIPSQVTYNGYLIFQSSVAAKDSNIYNVASGEHKQYLTYACGKVYPERVDDYAWESDLIAYRIYGPALQKSGERAFGNDIWLKNNTLLPVVENRYNAELKDKISYHQNHGNGFDCYKVGPTLGAGGTAILNAGDIIYPYCYSECTILDNGPLRVTASFKYLPTELPDGKVVENRIISLDKGAFLNRTTIWFEGQKDNLQLLSGIVLHGKNNSVSYLEDIHAITYSEPTEGAPNEGEIFVALLFPNGWEKAQESFGHAAVNNTLAPDSKLTYYWGALWSKSTAISVPDKSTFDSIVANNALNLVNPLRVKIK